MKRSCGLTHVAAFLIAAALIPGQALACSLLTDVFQYPEGSTLAGQSGGMERPGALWTSDWYADEFLISNGKATVGATGSVEKRVSRDIDLDSAGGIVDAVLFAAEMTKYTGDHSSYFTSVEFTDSEGVTAAFGIDDDRFFGTLDTGRNAIRHQTGAIGLRRVR